EPLPKARVSRQREAPQNARERAPTAARSVSRTSLPMIFAPCGAIARKRGKTHTAISASESGRFLSSLHIRKVRRKNASRNSTRSPASSCFGRYRRYAGSSTVRMRASGCTRKFNALRKKRVLPLENSVFIQKNVLFSKDS